MPRPWQPVMMKKSLSIKVHRGEDANDLSFISKEVWLH